MSTGFSLIRDITHYFVSGQLVSQTLQQFLVFSIPSSNWPRASKIEGGKADIGLWKTDKKETADLYELYFFRKQNESIQVLRLNTDSLLHMTLHHYIPP